jgi:fructose-1,6-bisphosphatase II / sedoheptulose-1,7-bisphosphatase
VHLITDGDVAGIINTTKPETGIDLYLGSGGAPEGVLAAAALKCVGGQFQGRLTFRNDEERARAERHGVEDLKKRYTLDELVTTDAIFVAGGVTTGSLLDGVRFTNGSVSAHALAMNSATGTVAELRVKRPAD